MPLIAVAGIVAGASTLAAGAGILGTIGALGGIVGGIGVLTKSKELTALGAVAGLVGGVGAFASSQGWIGGAADAAAGAGAAADGTTSALIKQAAPGLESPTAGLVQDAANAGEWTGAASDAADMAMAGAGTQTSGLPNTSIMGNVAAPAAELSPASENLNLFKGPAETINPDVNALDLRLARGETPSSLLPSSGATLGKGIFDTLKGFGEWAEKNKMLASIGAQFVGGMFDEEKKARTDLYKTRAEVEKQQAANGNSVPRLNATTKSTGPIFRPNTPTYNPVVPQSLWNAVR